MKKVLFIAVAMGGYEAEIVHALERHGFEVDLFGQATKIDRHHLTLWQRIARFGQ